MHVLETAIVYGLVGAVVAAALELQSDETSPWRRLLVVPLHLSCWPFFAPMLLTSESTRRRAEPTGDGSPAECDVACDLETVETRLFEALDGLDGVAEEVVDEERRRVRTLLERLHEMQSRLDEMDRLLDRPEFDEARIQRQLERIGADEASANDDRRIESLHNRLEHTRRLRRMRSRLHDEFESALFKIDEISSNMALLTLTDRPGDELADSIEDVAATVEGLSEELLSA